MKAGLLVLAYDRWWTAQEGFQWSNLLASVQALRCDCLRAAVCSPAAMLQAWEWLTGGSGRAKSPAVVDAERSFDIDELHCIHAQVRGYRADLAAARGQHPSQVSLQRDDLVWGLCRLPKSPRTHEALAAALYDAVASDSKAGVTEDDVVVAKAQCERQDGRAAARFAYRLLTCLALNMCPKATSSSDGASCIPEDALVSALGACTQLVMQVPPPQHLLEALAAGALHSAKSGAGTAGLTLDGYMTWSHSWPAVNHLLTALLQGIGRTGAGTPQPRFLQLLPGGPGVFAAEASPQCAEASTSAEWQPPPIPERQGLGRAHEEDLLLQPIWCWLLGSTLPKELQEGWRCIFNSSRDGHSYNTMMGRLASCQAPSLVMVCDADGNTFGGFAPHPWAKCGTFFGDHSTFIFGLLPEVKKWSATGYNEKFQWCGAGFSQLPSGIGFGGAQSQDGQFALYVDSTLDAGMSRPIATFGNDPLSAQQIFEVSCVECWQLKPNEEEMGPSSMQGGVLGAETQSTRHILGLAGIQVDHSQGLREDAHRGE